MSDGSPGLAIDGDSDRLLDEIALVYRASFSRFLRVAAAIVGDPELGRDAVQESFARAILRRSEYRGDGPLEAWLWRILVNHSRNYRRSEGFAACVSSGPESCGAVWPVESADETLRQLIGRLPERQRLALFLRYYADFDYRQIGAALGIRTGTVAATLNAAHRALRARLLQRSTGTEKT
jgi:RNA polymerase sigma-70 factor (ECF subfamily)